MSQERWTAVDSYFADLLVPADPVLEGAVEAIAAAGMPAHSVSPAQGKLLWLLARAQGARTILEIGALGGYSTIWLARALPEGGSLLTLEVDRRHAEVARANVAAAGLAGVVHIRLGLAIDTLARLVAERSGPFDLVFLDADKENNPRYLEWALELTRPGSLIVADNVVRDGAVLDEDSRDPAVRGLRRFHELLAADPRVSATAIQTVGAKGYDGFVVALVLPGSD
jgi:predicted O-methyltransferase YrrM